MPAGKGRIGQKENKKMTWLWFSPSSFSWVYWQAPGWAADCHPSSKSQTPFAHPSPCTLRVPGKACLQGVSVSSRKPKCEWTSKLQGGRERWCKFPSPRWNPALCQLVLHYAHLKLLQLSISILEHSFILLPQRPAPALHKSLMKCSASSTDAYEQKAELKENTVLLPKNQSSSTDSTWKLHLLHLSGIPEAPLKRR